MSPFISGRKSTEGLAPRTAAVEAIGGREPAAQKAGGRSYPRQADAVGCAHKKVLKPAQKRRLADSLDMAYRVGMRRACAVVGLQRSVYYYKSIKDDRVLTQRIREIAEIRIRYGYLRIYVLLRREGWHVNHKRVYRIYCKEGLNLRHKRPRRRVAAAHRMKRPEVSSIDQCWSMDSVPTTCSTAVESGR